MRSSVQVLIVGGGINGAGVAREATARGFSTMLVEKNDFGHATSGNSSKGIGGSSQFALLAYTKEDNSEGKLPHII